MTRYLGAMALCAVIYLPLVARAQGPGPEQPDMPIDAQTAHEVVEAVVKALNAEYVFPETASKMEKAVRERLDKKEYEGISSSKEFAKALTDHLQEVSKDKHLRVVYSYGPVRIPPSPEKPGRADPTEIRAAGDAINYGFDKVERLPGNVGYLELRGFFPAEFGGETAAAAMNFLANSDALIIDLRRNGGGAPSMVALLCSYLFAPEPVHLNDLYFRPDDSTHQWWTLPYVPGKRYEDKPVYLLTSSRTFSAAEEFTYNLKNLKRATIVGETTGGGAHPGGVKRVGEHFGVFVPSGRAINPVSKTNWEGTGVAPDMDVPADHALKTAHLAALKKVVEDLEAKQESGGKVGPGRIEGVKRAIDDVQKELDELKKASRKEGEKP
jgi:hypothetical protein